jgi:hypothetical protein
MLRIVRTSAAENKFLGENVHPSVRIQIHRLGKPISTLFLCLWPFVAVAQAPGTGAITGTVFDPSSAVVANASISVVCEEANISRTTATAADGTFSVYLLPPGACSVSVEAHGFNKEIVPDVSVTVSETAKFDIHLLVSAAANEVNNRSSHCRWPIEISPRF